MRRHNASTRKTRRFRIIQIFGARIARVRNQSPPRQENFCENNFMPQVPIIMPQLGESIAEATVVDVKVKVGDQVAADQEIIDVETNKAVMGVTTPCKGRIDKITAQAKETYPVGAVLGYVEASEEDAAKFKKTAPEPPQQELAKEIPGRDARCELPVAESSRTHVRIAIKQCRSRRNFRDWRGQSRHDQRPGKFSEQDRQSNGRGSFRDSRRSGGRDATQLDATAFDHRLVSQSRSGVARSTVARAEARSRALRDSRACARARGKSQRGRKINREPGRAI